MFQNKSTRLLVVSSCLLLVGLVATAQDPPGRATVNENTEVLFGIYTCSVSFDPPSAFTYIGFEASGDIFQQIPNLYRAFKGDVASPELCDGLSAASAGVLGQASCTVGPVEVTSEESYTAREFRFVCHAKRSEIISLVAKVSAQHLTAAP